MLTAISAILIFLAVILVHEFGHFAVAKLVGIEVNEFSIGMGPKILQKEIGETQYTLRLLPIGGYVKMEGEDETSNNPRSFNNANVLSRIGVLLAGSLMNFLLAIIALSIAFYGFGVGTTSVKTRDNMPAAESGMISGDTIVSINKKPVDTWNSVVENINDAPKDKEIEVGIIRNNEELNFYVEPTTVDGKNMIGIETIVEKSVATGIKSGFEYTGIIIKALFEFIGDIFRGNFSVDNLSGPVGVVKEVGEFARRGIFDLLLFLGFISINLGFLNLLPLPALDGSRITFLLVELIRGKPVDPEKEGFIHFLGFMFLITLMIIVTYKDIISLNIFNR